MTRIAARAFAHGVAAGLVLFAAYVAGAVLAEHARGRRWWA